MLAVLALSLQAAFAASSMGPVRQDPDIQIPASSLPVWYASSAAQTNHLIFTGISQSEHRTSFPIPLAMHGPSASNPGGYWPSDIQTAYNVPPSGGSYAIAIVDAYLYNTALNDFNAFASQFGLPQETSTNALASTNQVFQVAYEGNVAPTATNTGWNEEEALDIEWAHAIAPGAKIYLVEAHSSSLSDLYSSVQTAAALPNVKEISCSWGGAESSMEAFEDGVFMHTGITIFAATGDTGGTLEYPSVSPNVIAVGGTTLNMSGGAVTSETGWSSSGGGHSAYENLPSYQSSLSSLLGTKRGVPDMAAVADPHTGVAIYDTSAEPGWLVVGGTSVACPICAALTNDAGSFLASSNAELTRIYSGLGGSNFRDIVSGTAGSNKAAVGWDYVTGVGSPLGTSGL